MRREGDLTSQVYGAIKQQRYDHAIKILTTHLHQNPTARAALSLLGYCHFQIQDFDNAALYYQRLAEVCPENVDYKVSLVHSLIKATRYEEAQQAVLAIGDAPPSHEAKLTLLNAMACYDQDEISSARAYLEQLPHDEEEPLVMTGALLYKEGQYEAALQSFTESQAALGTSPQLAYNIGLCHYALQDMREAMRQASVVIDKAQQDYPYLLGGAGAAAATEMVAHSVGNSAALRDSGLVEALNLRAAVEWRLQNTEAAADYMQELPPRDESELDAVTLHNMAVLEAEARPEEAIRKMNFLLGQARSVPEVFSNLLVLYCKHAQFDLAADILAENSDLTFAMNPSEYEFLEALILSQSAPEDGYKQLEELAHKHVDTLRRLSKQVQDARRGREVEFVKKQLAAYDSALSAYVPVLMAQAKVAWDVENYALVEKLFRQAAEFTSDDPNWKLNVAHVFFKQEKYKECVRYYEPIVRKHQDNLLGVTAIVLANLCAAYVMTSMNEDAEELMKAVERAEEKLLADPANLPVAGQPPKQVYHLCIINLVIGTLYCSKGNLEFGISRIIKSLDPVERKLGPDTWFYAKRCFLALAETVAKNLVMIKDDVFDDIFAFLDQAGSVGRRMPLPPPAQQKRGAAGGYGGQPPTSGRHTIGAEARMLKNFFLKLRE